MSMFRSPHGDSTSDPESSSDEHDEHESSFGKRQKPFVHDADVKGSSLGGLLQRQETASESIPGNDATWESTDWLPNTAEQHATLLLSSLLEFTYNVKAAEHLNRAQGTTRFHFQSPEARARGASMYQGASKVLASNGIIADCVHEEGWSDMRRRYIIGVDNLGLQAFNESMSWQASPARGRVNRQDTNVLIRRTSRPRQEFFNVLGSTYVPAQLLNTNQHREMMAAMVQNLAVPSPHTGMQLSPSPSVASGNRYKADFWELSRLGKGAFGTVYHVKNFVDNQDYAVKKIPLNPNRLKKWQKNGAKEVELLLKEIRTLARLEHSNVVRYYGAWIEGADGPIAAVDTGKIPHQLYLKDKPASTNGPSSSSKQRQELPIQAWQDEDSIDGVFNNDNPQRSVCLPNTTDDDFMGIVFGEDSDTLSKTHHDIAPNQDQVHSQRPHVQQEIRCQPSSATSLSNETDIFTDGDGEVRSGKLQKQDPLGQPMMVLHIQMSLHPLSLSTYLACSEEDSSLNPSRHCFHLLPSLRLIRAILSGVSYLHSQGIIHRDLKPGNIFLSQHHEYDQRPGCVDINCTKCKQPSKIKRYLNPRIGDFGLAADISGLNDDPTSVESTSSGFASKAVGTEFYRPPLASRTHSNRWQAIDEKLDVFALGILLFELLWRMNTKMERHMLLSDLSKEGVLPEEFARKVDPSCKAWSGGDGVDDGNRVGLNTVGDFVEDCIRHMVCALPEKRWGCGRVRERLDAVIGRLEE